MRENSHVRFGEGGGETHRLQGRKVRSAPTLRSGNFLYVTLELMKRLEGEVLNTLRDLGAGQLHLEMESVMVNPRQFLGIEVNPRAAAIAELVLWIGFLQWHLRTRGDVNPPEPIVQNIHNIECRDAVLAWDDVRIRQGPDGRPVMRWDGRTSRPHPVTGESVPDETAQLPVYDYVNPRPAEWPDADYIVGNPPFVGDKRMRETLGEGYVDALRLVYGKQISSSADYVMYWWDKAARLARSRKLQAFGLIATSSITQKFNRRIVEEHLNAKDPLLLSFAIPNHPWVDTADGADVRISMTVGLLNGGSGTLAQVVEENSPNGENHVQLEERDGKINADLTLGADVSKAVDILGNLGICSNGVQLSGMGFVVSKKEADRLGFGQLPELTEYIRLYRNGRDLMGRSRDVFVIDLFGLEINEVRARFPEVYQHIYQHVKPQRDQNGKHPLK